MADIYKGLTIRIGADTSRLDKALRAAQSSARSAASEVRKIDKALKADPANAKLLAAQQQAYRKEIEATEQKLDALRAAEEQIGRENMSTEQWTQLQADIEIAEKDLERYNRQLERARTAQAAANTALGQAGARLTEIGDRLDPVGRKMESLGGKLTIGVTAPIVAGAGAAVKAATDLDTSLTNVKKTVDGTAEDYERLKDAAIEYSKVNAVKASDILDIEALGAQLGFTLDLFSNGKSQVQEFGEVVSGLDIATNMSAEQAGTELAQFFNIMGENRELVSNYGSAIVGLGNNFATTESDISAMAMRIAGAGKSIGLSSADVLGMATALSSLGIEAEAGGTAISTVMSSIDKSVATSDENLATWAQTAHMSVDEFTQAWGSDAVGALDAVLKGMAADVDAGGNLSVMLDELGISSLRQTDMMKRLANSGDLMRSAVARANDEWASNTALSAEVENRNDSLAAKFEMLRNRVTAVAVEIGEPLADALFELIDAAEPLFQAIEDGTRTFAEMSDGEQQAVIQTVALIAAIGPALSLFGRVTRSISVVGRALTAMSRIVGRAKVGIQGMGESMRSTQREAAVMQRQAAMSGRSMSSLGANARVAGNALKASTAAAKAARVAMAALGTAGVMIAITAVVELVSWLGQLYERHEKARKATDGLRDAIGTLGNRTAEGARGLGEAGTAVDGYRASVEDCIEKQAELADQIAEDFAATNRDAGALDFYAQKIASLAGNCDGSQQALAELEVALEGYNSIAGTSYSVIDSATGALDISTEAILRNAEAWEVNAYKQAAAEKMTELAKQQIDNQMALDDATTAYEAALEQLNSEHETLGYNTQDTIGKYSAAKTAMDEARATCNSNAEAMERLTHYSAEYQGELDRLTGSALRPWIEANEEVTAKLGEIGLETDVAAARMSQLGYTSESMAALTADQFAAMASSTGASIGDMIGLAGQLGIELPPAIQSALDDADRICGVGGQGIVREFIAGMSVMEYDAISKAAEVSGRSADELMVAAAEAGVAGQAQVDEFVAGIESGMTPAEAAAAAVGKSASDALAGNSEGAPAGEELSGSFSDNVDANAAVANSVKMASNAVGMARKAADARTVGERLSSTAPAGVNTLAMDPKARQMVGNALAAARSVDSTAAGRDFSTGAANGINVTAMVAKAAQMGANAIAALKGALSEASPSKAAMKLGAYFSEGAAIGIEDGIPDVEQASRRLAAAAMKSAEMSVPNLAGSYETAHAARQVARVLQQGGPSYTISMNGVSVNDTPAIRDAVLTLIGEARVSATARRRA